MKILELLTLFIPSKVFADSLIDDPMGEPAMMADDITELIMRSLSIVLVIAGAIAVAMMIWGGVMLATSGGNEERTTKGKKILTYAVGGLLLITLSQFIVVIFINMLGGKTG